MTINHMNTISKYISAAAPALLALSMLASCEDDVSPIGSGLFDQQVAVYVDSSAYNLLGHTVEAQNVDARSSSFMLGHISVPEYGQLSASFVSRILSAGEMQIPDSITTEMVDSMRLVIEMPRSMVTGDSLAPQQLTVYRLTKELPTDITSDFSPEGYYNPANPMGRANYTLSAIAYSDSAFRAYKNIPVSVKLPQAYARETFDAYREDPSIFEWPDRLSAKFPGIYVRPTFGRGCVAAISAAKFYTYWHYTIQRTVVEDEVTKKVNVLMKDSVCLFSTAPEVLASNNISYTPSEAIKARVAAGEEIVTTPLGYRVRFTFPGRKLIEDYRNSNKELSIINNLALSIPAEKIDNDFDIDPAPNMLMIQTDKIADFFAEGKVPDNLIAFSSAYDTEKQRYYFSQLRNYIVDLNQQYTALSEEEFDKLCDFTLIPVALTYETVTNSDNTTTKYVTGCTPYLAKPTMVKLDTGKSMIVFTYTHQNIQ